MKFKTNYLPFAFSTFLFAWLNAMMPVALAYDPAVLFAKVTMGEGSYLPGAIIFQIDLPAADCPAGALIVYDGGAALPPGTPAEADRKSNVKATHTKGPVRVHARNKPQGGNYFGSSWPSLAM